MKAIALQRGIERYVTEEFMSKVSGWKQFAIGAALGSFLPKLQSDMDIEPIYASMKTQFQKSPDLKLTAEDMRSMHPVIGPIAATIFGEVTFHEADIDKLYSMIQEANNYVVGS